MSITSAYEKMQREGKLSTPIKLEQPTPDNPDGKAFGSNGNYNAGIKSIINEKVEKKLPSLNEEVKTLKNRIKVLEDSLEIIMEQHIKLMGK